MYNYESAQVKVFPTKIFGQTIRIDRNTPGYILDTAVESKWQFIWGKETVVETEIDQTEYTSLGGPKTDLLNIFKFFVTVFCPDLKFGWLKPDMQVHKMPQKIITSNTIVNVIPLEEYNSNRHVQFLEYSSLL